MKTTWAGSWSDIIHYVTDEVGTSSLGIMSPFDLTLYPKMNVDMIEPFFFKLDNLPQNKFRPL